MDLPAELRQAVSSLGGGRIALVIGAGCSVEPPTGVPVASQCSVEVHRRLLDDGVLQNGDCVDPSDLSAVADAVFARTHSQRDVVERLRDRYNLKLATPNNGHLLAAAMLCEGAISSVVTLNFDLALSIALGWLGAEQIVGVIECPEDLSRQKTINVYYLHRNVNAPDPESWVLRTTTLNKDWEGHWEPIVTTKVLSAPVVVFAGLGTPVAVLIASTKLLRKAVPAVTKLYQVDPVDKASSKFFQELELHASNYIQCGRCEFMDELSQRLLKEHVYRLEQAVVQIIRDNQLLTEEVTDLLTRLQALGLVKLGMLRAHWLLHDKSYYPVEAIALDLVADLLLAIAMIARVSGTVAVIIEDGVVEFHRDGRTVVVYIIASGRGSRGRSAIEAKVELRRKQYRSRVTPPRGVIVGGTSDFWTTAVTPPPDLIRGDVSDDILGEPTAFPLHHINELREHPNRIFKVVP